MKGFDVGGEGAAAGSAGGLVGGGLEEVDLLTIEERVKGVGVVARNFTLT